MIVIIQPETNGTIDELQKIETRVPAEYLVKLGTSGVSAPVEAVYSHLPSASVVHFACYGQQDTNNPPESTLILVDGQLKMSQIAAQPMPNAPLAFLNSFQAVVDESLQDEVIHSAAALLFAGFRGVVTTMW